MHRPEIARLSHHLVLLARQCLAAPSSFLRPSFEVLHLWSFFSIQQYILILVPSHFWQ
jgi:hypothetical protein